MTPTLSKPRSRVTRARTGPCAVSARAARKKKSPSFALVSSGEVAEGLMLTTPAGPVTRSATGRELALELGPTMAWTPSVSTSRRASATAVSLSVPVSPRADSTSKPNTPPASLTCSMARRKPRSLQAERSADPPVKLISSPIFSGSRSASAGPSPEPPQDTAMPSARTATATNARTRCAAAGVTP